MSFEQRIAALEECLAKLESGELTLEDSLKLYEQGAEHLKELDKILAESAGRLEKLFADGHAEPFAEEAP